MDAVETTDELFLGMARDQCYIPGDDDPVGQDLLIQAAEVLKRRRLKALGVVATAEKPTKESAEQPQKVKLEPTPKWHQPPPRVPRPPADPPPSLQVQDGVASESQNGLQ